MPVRKHFSVELKLPSGTLAVPSKPIDLPSGAYGIWPVNLDLGGGLMLRYSTAQLFHRFTLRGDTYLCFFAIPGVDPEFAVETAAKPIELTPGLSRRVESQRTYLNAHDLAQPQDAVFATGASNVHLLLLSREQAENTWRVPGQSSPMLTTAQFYADKDTVTLQADGDPNISFSVFAGVAKPTASASLESSGTSALLKTYTAHFVAKHLGASLVPVSPGSPRGPLQYGPSFAWRKQPIPKAPDEDAFQHASAWTLNLPESLPSALSDARLVLHYSGDVARLSVDGRLIDDDFWNGKPWELSLKDLRYEGVRHQAQLQVLPWPSDPPMYLEASIGTDASHGKTPGKPAIELIPQYQLELHLAR